MANLVNESSGEVISVPKGDNTIGRGPLLKVLDKRVSRNHALLRFKDDKLSIFPKHANPTFYKAADATSYVALVRDQWKELDNGDRISLLPNGEIAFKVEVKSQVIMPADPASDDITPPTSPQQHNKKVSAPVKVKDQPRSPHRQAPPSSHAASEQEPQTAKTSTSAQHKTDAKPSNVESESAAPGSSKKKDDSPIDDLLFGDFSPAPPEAVAGVEPASRLDAKPATVPVGSSLALHAVSEKSKEEGEKSEEMDTEESPLVQQTAPPSLTVKGKNSKPAGSTNRRRVLPAWLASISESSLSSSSVSKVQKAPPKPRAPAKKKTKQLDDEEDDSVPSSKAPARKPQPKKRPSVEDNDDKPAKKRPATQRATSQKGKDAPSAAKASSPSPPKDEEEDMDLGSKDAAAEVTTTKKNKLPLCPYGTKCYRKNPVHFREYSHDFAAADSESEGEGAKPDEGSEEDDTSKPVCPYGASCYRKNPAHRKEYAHPKAGTRRSTRTTKGKKPKRSVLAGDSDDESQPNTYDYNDSFIDDDDDEVSSSPYSTDDSDWAPGGGGEGGGASLEDEEEDVAELVADAKEFISNKKMRR